MIAIEHLARHRGAGGFAPARQQRLAQFDQAGRVLLVLRRSERRSSVRPRSEIEARRSEKKALLLLMPGGSLPNQVEILHGI